MTKTTRDIVATTAETTTKVVIADPITGTIVSKAVGLMVRATFDHVMERKRVSAEKLCARVLGTDSDEVTSEEIAGIIEAHQDEPFVQETIFRAVRALVDSVDPVVMQPLAVLAQDYLRRKQTPDWFFRGTTRLLSDLSREEFLELRKLLEWIAAEVPNEHMSVMCERLGYDGDDPTTDCQEGPFEVRLGFRVNGPKDVTWIERTGFFYVERFLWLLINTGMGSVPSGMTFGSNANRMSLRKSVARRLWRVMSVAE